MVKVRLIGLVLLILALSACARTAPPVQTPAAGVLREVQVYHPSGPRVQADGLEPVLLTEYPIYVALTFEPGVDQAAVEQALQVTGPAPQEQSWSGETLTLRLPDDQPGPWEFQLDKIRYRDRAAFALEVQRVRNNRARVTVGDQTLAWVEPPAATAQTWDLSETYAERLPLKPVKMSIQFDHPVVRPSIQKQIESNAVDVPLRFYWDSDTEVTITVPPKLAEVRIDWTGAKDLEGLRLWTPGYTLRFDGGHQLLGVDPATGKSEVLHTVQMAVAGAFLSPDRTHLALVRAAEGTPDQRVFLFNLRTGLLTDTGQTIPADDMRLEFPLDWPDVDQVKVVPGGSEPRPHQSRSFDGRWLAEVVVDQSAATTADGPVPGLLTVTDLPTGRVARRVRLELAQAKYGVAMPSLVWSQDNDWLAFAAAPAAATGERVIQALNLASGEVRNLGRYPGPTPSVWGPSGWSPDREMLAYEGLLVRDGEASVVGGAPAIGGWVDPWSPSGQFLVYREERELIALDPATGARTSLGEGFLAGWLNDGRALVVSGGGVGR